MPDTTSERTTSDQPYNENRQFTPVQVSASERPFAAIASQGSRIHTGYSAGHSAGRRDAGERAKGDDYNDPSSIIWSLYLTEAQKEDQALMDNMTADTNGILVFTGLFAAVVAAFIIESYKFLQPDSGASTVVLLAQISEQLALPTNGSAPPRPSQTPPFDPSSFSPPSSALRVNILWFLSLSLSLLCALAATLMQQWARRYMSNTRDAQRAGSIQRQGRIHAYLFQGLQVFRFRTAVEFLPALLHTSVALFFAGLIDFLFTINKTVAYFLLPFVTWTVVAYTVLTVLPTRYLNSPYGTPLSSIPVSYAATSVLHGLLRIVSSICASIYRASIPGSSSRYMRILSMTGDRHASVCVRAGVRMVAFFDKFLSAVTRASGRTLAPLASAIATAKKWQDAVHRSQLVKFDEATKSIPSLGRDTLDWTLAMVMDDDASVEKVAVGLPSFLASPAPPIVEAKMLETLQSYRFVARVCQLLANLDATGSSPVGGAARNHRALAYLLCLRKLMSGRYATLFTQDVSLMTTKILVELRTDVNADVAVHASCTAAMFALCLHGYSRLHPWESVRTHLHILFLPFDPVDERHPHGPDRLFLGIPGLTNVPRLVRAVLPYLSSASPDGVSLVLETLSAISPDPPFDRRTENFWNYIFLECPAIAQRLGALRPEIVNAADEDGAQELANLVNGEVPPGCPMKSPYAQLYDKLRPLYHWLAGFNARIWLYGVDHQAFGQLEADRRARVRATLESVLKDKALERDAEHELLIIAQDPARLESEEILSKQGVESRDERASVLATSNLGSDVVVMQRPVDWTGGRHRRAFAGGEGSTSEVHITSIDPPGGEEQR